MRRFRVSVIVGALVLALATSDLAAQTHFCVVEDAAFETGNGGCQDLATALAWSTHTPAGPGGWNWALANQTCEDLQEGGFSDWRLPTVEELQAANANGAPTHFDYPICGPNNCCKYWSSKKQGPWAWAVCLMQTGEKDRILAESAMSFACVRESSDCGNGVCDSTEDECSCPADCGDPPATEVDCSDGLDDDCDGASDCADADCDGDPACACSPKNASCSTDEECCSGVCKNNGRCR